MYQCGSRDMYFDPEMDREEIEEEMEMGSLITSLNGPHGE
jgi:hypothetical protein